MGNSAGAATQRMLLDYLGDSRILGTDGVKEIWGGQSVSIFTLILSQETQSQGLI